jgi:hypothetical protein
MARTRLVRPLPLTLRLVAARFVMQMFSGHEAATCFSNSSRKTG